MAVLYLPVAIPGSGKTTFCKKFINENKGVVHLSSDGLRGVLGRDETDQSVSKEVFATMRVMVDYFLKNDISVIVDATNVSRKSRAPFIEIARKHNAFVYGWYFDVPFDVSQQRNANRERRVPVEVLHRMRDNTEIPAWPEVHYVVYLGENS